MILIIVLSLGTLELWKANAIKTVAPTQLHRLARLAGRVIENAFVSATIDVLMIEVLTKLQGQRKRPRNENDQEVGHDSTTYLRHNLILGHYVV